MHDRWLPNVDFKDELMHKNSIRNDKNGFSARVSDVQFYNIT